MAKKHKNLLAPTPKQIKYRNELWAKALEENDRKAIGTMEDKYGGRCCLQVAEDVAIACGIDIKRSGKNNGGTQPEVRKFFGWGAVNPSMLLPNGKTMQASAVNDGDEATGSGKKGFSHRKIAEIVRNTFVRKAKDVKWTFNMIKSK